jgi:Na+/H+ antiporter NhaD/arsenite permease-like protein
MAATLTVAPPFPVLVLLVVLVLIAARRVGRLRIAIWQSMAAGALAVLVAGNISPLAALRAIDPEVMLFLFGMFLVGQALVASRYLFHLAHRLFCLTRSTDTLLFALMLGAGLASAVLMNDTLAIVGTPLALRLAREHRLAPRLLLLALAFGVTIGSVPSPIGNPQNLLVAVRTGMESPFLTFAGWLALPTLINLLLAFAVLRVAYRQEFHRVPLVHVVEELRDPLLVRLARLSLVLVLVLVGLRAVLLAPGVGVHLPLSSIALVAAAPLLAHPRQRWRLLRDLDWETLVFFAAMFVLMEAVWNTGYFQGWMGWLALDVSAVPSVMGVGVLLSQLISNVPLTALYLPLLAQAGADTPAYMALVAGGTIAGNLLILGAASNVIIIQRAERDGQTLGFLEFARVGVPLTALNFLVYYLFLI